VTALYFEIEDPDDLRNGIFQITITLPLPKQIGHLVTQGRAEKPLGTV
jgi:hypothetical protein